MFGRGHGIQWNDARLEQLLARVGNYKVVLTTAITGKGDG